MNSIRSRAHIETRSFDTLPNAHTGTSSLRFISQLGLLLVFFITNDFNFGFIDVQLLSFASCYSETGLLLRF